jgi:hypothetical protein
MFYQICIIVLLSDLYYYYGICFIRYVLCVYYWTTAVILSCDCNYDDLHIHMRLYSR